MVSGRWGEALGRLSAAQRVMQRGKFSPDGPSLTTEGRREGICHKGLVFSSILAMIAPTPAALAA